MGKNVERRKEEMEERREGHRKGGREEGGRGTKPQRSPVQAVGCTGWGRASPPPSLASLPPQTTPEPHANPAKPVTSAPVLSPLEPVKTVSQWVTWPRLDLTRFVKSVKSCWLLRSNSISTRVPSSTSSSRENHGISSSFLFCNSVVSHKS